jgi:hypothetical protein
MAGIINGTAYNPTTGAKWVAEVWAKTIDRQANEKAVVWPRVLEMDQLKNKLHIPKNDVLSTSVISDATDILEPTFSANTETEVTVSPIMNNVNVAVDYRTIERMMLDPRDTLKQNIEMALGVSLDKQVTALWSSLTTNVGGTYAADLDLPTILAARSQVKAGAKEYADPGKYVLCYHHLQDDAVMGIGQFTQFYIRGDKQNPAVGGVIGEAYGIQFVPTGNVVNSGGGYNNCLFIERAFVLSFNQRPTIKLQEHGLSHWLMGWSDAGAATLRDPYAALLKSKNT